MSLPTPSKKFESLDFVKGLACIGVVLMHSNVPGITGKITLYLFKFSIPCFLMISGFFLYSKDESKYVQKLKKRIGKIFDMLLFSFILYGIISLIRAYFEWDNFSISSWLSHYFPLLLLPKKIFFGTFFNGTMWYLYAVLWAYIILWLWCHKFSLAKLEIVGPLFLVLHILVRAYSEPLGLGTIDATYWRSWLFWALPFIIMGYSCAKYKEKVINLFSDKILWAITVVSFVTQFAEYAFFGKSIDCYFSTIIFSLACFLLAIKHPHAKVNNAIHYIGEYLSMPVYIIHVAMIMVALLIISSFHLSMWFCPILSLPLSIAAAQLWVTFNKRKN